MAICMHTGVHVFIVLWIIFSSSDPSLLFNSLGLEVCNKQSLSWTLLVFRHLDVCNLMYVFLYCCALLYCASSYYFCKASPQASPEQL